MVSDQKFNIRVYGLLLVNNCVLVSDEFLWGKSLTKFPGGGLEWGEGTIDCLRREFQEELGLAVTVEKLFYVTDFFQESLLDKDQQIISIYYRVSSLDHGAIPVKSTPHDHAVREHESQVFRWLALNEMKPEDFYFPIDKIVVQQLHKLYERQ
jgi:8-oxo-dGTP diphosphatase